MKQMIQVYTDNFQAADNQSGLQYLADLDTHNWAFTLVYQQKTLHATLLDYA